MRVRTTARYKSVCFVLAMLRRSKRINSNAGDSAQMINSATLIEAGNKGLDRVSQLEDKIEALTAAVEKMAGLKTPSTPPVSPPRSRPVPRTPSGRNTVTPPALPEQDLMSRTAEIVASNSQVEKNMSQLTCSSQAAWMTYRQKWLNYVRKHGIRKLVDWFDNDTLIAYTTLLDLPDIDSISNESLFFKIDSEHEIINSTLSLFDKIKMDDVKVYNKEKIQKYLQSFLVLLDRYPQIRIELKERVIIQEFFSKIKPDSIAVYLLKLQLDNLGDAFTALKQRLKFKDVQTEENLQDSLCNGKADHSKNDKVNTTKTNDKKDNKPEPLLDAKGNLVLCLNCKHSKNKKINKNHYMVNCKSLNFCIQCQAHHFPYGPDCDYEDIKVFNYPAYVKARKELDYNLSLGDNLKPTPIAKSNNSSAVVTSKKSGNKNSSITNMNEAMNTMSDADFDNFIRSSVANRSKNKNTKISDIEEVFYFDSAANDTYFNNVSLSDSIVDMNRLKTNDTVTVAGGQKLPIKGSGTILNHTSRYTPQFHTSLLSVQKTLASNDSLALFTDKDVHVVRNSPNIKKLVNFIIQKSKSNKTFLFNGDVVNGMYVVKGNSILQNSNVHLHEKTSLDNTTDNWNTTIEELKAFNLLSNSNFNFDIIDIDSERMNTKEFKFANSSYYTNIPTAKVTSAAELVRYFHEGLNHASKELMCRIVEHKLIDNLPDVLTKKLINKHFPSCETCPRGNLARRPIVNRRADRVLVKGEE